MYTVLSSGSRAESWAPLDLIAQQGPTETVKGGVEHEGHGWSWRDLGGQRIVGVRGQELGTKPCRRHRWP